MSVPDLAPDDDDDLIWLYMSRESLESFILGYQNKMYIEKRCVMNFLPCPFISLSVSFSISLSISLSVSLSLPLYLSCSLSLPHLSLSILLSLPIYLSISTSSSLRLNISVYLSLPIFPRLSPSFSCSLTHPFPFNSVSQLYLSPPSLSLGFTAMMSFF